MTPEERQRWAMLKLEELRASTEQPAPPPQTEAEGRTVEEWLEAMRPALEAEGEVGREWLRATEALLETPLGGAVAELVRLEEADHRRLVALIREVRQRLRVLVASTSGTGS